MNLGLWVPGGELDELESTARETLTVPAGEIWWLLYGRARVVADSNTATRVFTVEIRDPDNTGVLVLARRSVTASVTEQTGLGREAQSSDEAYTDSVQIAPYLLLGPSWDINITLTNEQAGDTTLLIMTRLRWKTRVVSDTF